MERELQSYPFLYVVGPLVQRAAGSVLSMGVGGGGGVEVSCWGRGTPSNRHRFDE